MMMMMIIIIIIIIMTTMMMMKMKAWRGGNTQPGPCRLQRRAIGLGRSPLPCRVFAEGSALSALNWVGEPCVAGPRGPPSSSSSSSSFYIKIHIFSNFCIFGGPGVPKINFGGLGPPKLIFLLNSLNFRPGNDRKS